MPRVERLVVCLLIIILDIIAGVLGIEAEIAQNKGRYLKAFIFDCKAPVLQAYKLGLSAAVLLSVAHAIANLFGGCTCICSREELKQSSPDRQVAAVALVLSWISLAGGFTLLMTGTMANSQSRTPCQLPHRRLLAIGGVLCFVHGLFSIAYYVSAVAAAQEEERRRTEEEGREVHA